MKKSTAVLTVNAVILGFVFLNAYKPQLAELDDKYKRTKKNTKNKTVQRNEKKEIIREVVKVVGEPEDLTKKALETTELSSINTEKIIPTQIRDFIVEKVESTSFELALVPINNEVLYPTWETVIPKLPSYNEEKGNQLNDIKMPSNKTLANYIKYACGALAIVTSLNFVNTNTIDIEDVKFAIESAKEDIDEIFTDTLDTIVTLNNHEKLVERKVNRIAESEQSNILKLTSIFNLEELSIEEKTREIIAINNIDYKTKFDFFMENPSYTLDETIRIITTSNLTTYENIFNYIMDIESLSLKEKIGYIESSNLVDYKKVFDFLLSKDNIPKSIAHEYITNSTLATYEEKFDYYMGVDLGNYEKVWNILNIPNQEFSKIFRDLINDKTLSEQVIIENIMKSDLVSFKILFDNIKKIDGITETKLSEYIIYYNTYYNSGYNTVSLEDLIHYTLNIDTFDHETKVNTIWGILDLLTLNEKSDFILNYYNMDFENDYIRLVTNFKTTPTEDEQIVIDLFDKINALKEEFVIENYNMNNSDEIKITAAGCAAEGARAYKDLYWVANTMFNRSTDPWYNKKGISPYLQFIDSGQFSVYANKSYLAFLYPKNDDDKAQYIRAYIALITMFYDGYDGIEHDYIDFRSSDSIDYSNNMVVPNGNRYGKVLARKNRIEIEELNGSEEYFD